MYFKNNGETDHAAKYIKSRIITKLIDSAIYIYTSEKKCVVLKGMLQ